MQDLRPQYEALCQVPSDKIYETRPVAKASREDLKIPLKVQHKIGGIRFIIEFEGRAI